MARALRAGRAPGLGLVAHEVMYDLAREMARADIPVGLEHDVAALTIPNLPLDLAAFPADFDTALRVLAEGERDALILTDLRGLTLSEAADVLGTSHPTVYRRRESARNILREEIAA